jgi:hypothetical protein
MKRILLILLFFCCFFSFPTKSFASQNFTTDYQVTYAVNESGMTQARLTVTLTNTTSQYYASSYKMQLGFEDIRNVKASDPNGPLTPKVVKTADGYSIDVPFNKKSVGLNSKMPFSITFDTPTIAKQYGNIWEINIPGIANPEDFSHFTVAVTIPPSFGKPAYIKPKQPDNSLTFTKEQLGKSGISLAFGTKQQYDFDLVYHINDNKIYPITTEIALPPSTNYQEVALSDINPKPINVREDSDGNWLAQYKLLPSQKLDIIVSGTAQLSLIPQKETLSPEKYQMYLQVQPYWETTSPEIKELANELKTPQSIYEYVIKTLTYDFSRVTDDSPRLGAVGALNSQQSAVCREFTDLFIAITRAAGIPAREVNGYAYTENVKQRPLSLQHDILHAWPEYYDKEKQTWVMVDPTWGSTTGGIDYFSILDFDHLTFAIKGKESNYPIPAGGYKLQGEKSIKDVSVTFSKQQQIMRPTISLTSDFPKTAIAGLPLIGKVTITNTRGTALEPGVLSLSAKGLTPTEQMIDTQKILPFGSKTWTVRFDQTSLLSKQKAVVSLHLNDQIKSETIIIAPFYQTPWGIGGIILVLLGISLLIIINKIRRVKLR